MSSEYLGGNIKPFRELLQLLLSNTVLAANDPGPQLIWPGEDRDSAILTGRGRPPQPLPLRNGAFLKLAIGLFIDRPTKRVKVSDSAYQYQMDADPNSKAWIFRYDYIRDPAIRYQATTQYPYPHAHLQVNADLLVKAELPKKSLSRVHFPTRRMPFEGVIRLLAEQDQFGVPCAQPASLWRPLLSEAEAQFLAVAHEAPLGPSAG
ncbi:MAG TPA: hypothetical protein VIT43_00865 [Candidatus Dormibacteraeota bacterium]